MSNLPQDTDDIVVPPFPFSEEEEMVVDSNATDVSIPKKKGQGSEPIGSLCSAKDYQRLSRSPSLA